MSFEVNVESSKIFDAEIWKDMWFQVLSNKRSTGWCESIRINVHFSQKTILKNEKILEFQRQIL